MTYCVPDLKAGEGVGCDLDYLGGKLDSNRNMVALAELSFDVSGDETAFSDP